MRTPLVLLLLGWIPSIAGAEVYLVTPDGTGDFPTIRAAVECMQVRDGDVIELADGVFRGNGNRDIDYFGKQITIRSQSGDPHGCILDCESGTVWHTGFILENVGSGAVLEGVTIRNGRSDSGGAIRIAGDSAPLIRRCILHQNYADIYGGAMYCGLGTAPTITQCTFAENTCLVSGGGLCI